jgi:hypothetical protein
MIMKKLIKKSIVFFTIFAMIAAAAYAGSVSRSIPSRAQPGNELTVTLSVSGATADKLFTIEDVIPQGLTIKEWTVTGAKEAKDDITTREKDNRFGWSFTPASASASVEYKIDLPSLESSYTFGKVVWFDPSGQGTESNSPTLTVAKIKCGDSICEGDENSDNCEQDCPKPALAPEPKAEPKAPAKAPEPVKSRAKGIIIWMVAILLVIIAVIYVIYQKKKYDY